MVGLEIFMVMMAILFFYPLYLVVINSFKTAGNIFKDPLNLPVKYMFANYSKSWELIDFGLLMKNSLLITALSIIGIVIVSGMAAWRIARKPSKLNNFLFMTFVASMIIPFSAVMIPFVQVMKAINLLNSLHGIIIMYIGFGSTLGVFLYHGFIKSVPLEIEESADIDGASIHQLYWKIVFPLLMPITVTVLVLNALWIWNEFLVPLIVLYDNNLKTIPTGTFKFFGQFMSRWDLALPAIVLGCLPIIIFFLFLQRYVIQGVMAGSVKG
jgi:raffinose/stachyose/melibiose transport system permease protein